MVRVAFILAISIMTVGLSPANSSRQTLADFDYIVNGQVVDVVDRTTRSTICQITAPVPIASVMVLPADLLLVGVDPRSTFDISEDAVIRSARLETATPVEGSPGMLVTATGFFLPDSRFVLDTDGAPFAVVDPLSIDPSGTTATFRVPFDLPRGNAREFGLRVTRNTAAEVLAGGPWVACGNATLRIYDLIFAIGILELNAQILVDNFPGNRDDLQNIAFHSAIKAELLLERAFLFLHSADNANTDGHLQGAWDLILRSVGEAAKALKELEKATDAGLNLSSISLALVEAYQRLGHDALANATSVLGPTDPRTVELSRLFSLGQQALADLRLQDSMNAWDALIDLCDRIVRSGTDIAIPVIQEGEKKPDCCHLADINFADRVDKHQFATTDHTVSLTITLDANAGYNISAIVGRKAEDPVRFLGLAEFKPTEKDEDADIDGRAQLRLHKQATHKEKCEHASKVTGEGKLKGKVQVGINGDSAAGGSGNVKLDLEYLNKYDTDLEPDTSKLLQAVGRIEARADKAGVQVGIGLDGPHVHIDIPKGKGAVVDLVGSFDATELKKFDEEAFNLQKRSITELSMACDGSYILCQVEAAFEIVGCKLEDLTPPDKGTHCKFIDRVSGQLGDCQHPTSVIEIDNKEARLALIKKKITAGPNLTLED